MRSRRMVRRTINKPVEKPVQVQEDPVPEKKVMESDAQHSANTTIRLLRNAGILSLKKSNVIKKDLNLNEFLRFGK